MVSIPITPVPQSCIVNNVWTIACIPIIIQNLVTFAFYLAGTVALFFIIWAGIGFITAGGDKEKIEKAKKTLTYAIIGLVFILLSGFFIETILSIFSTESNSIISW
jgi:membrane protease YdiL (CAAX protease family)